MPEQAIANLSMAVEKLKELNVISSNSFTSEIGVYHAKKHLNLKGILLKMQGYINEGYDAVDKNGIKYEIKTRCVNDKKTMRTKFSNVKNKKCDFIVFVVLDYNFQLLLLTKISKEFVLKNINNGQGDFYQTEEILNNKEIEIVFKDDLSDR